MSVFVNNQYSYRIIIAWPLVARLVHYIFKTIHVFVTVSWRCKTVGKINPRLVIPHEWYDPAVEYLLDPKCWITLDHQIKRDTMSQQMYNFYENACAHKKLCVPFTGACGLNFQPPTPFLIVFIRRERLLKTASWSSTS